MASINRSNKTASLTFETITKPFLFKQRTCPPNQQLESLYSFSYIYLHSVVLDTMRVSWGSEVTLTNPKNGKFTSVCVLSSDGILENSVEMDECVREQLDVRQGMCIHITAKTQNRVIHLSDHHENQQASRNIGSSLPTQLQYAYDKTQSYELISNMLNNKLKIQLKSLKYRQAPKLYYLEQSFDIEGLALSKILNFLQHEESYHVYPQKGVIEIITVDGQLINIELNEVVRPKTIDTEIIMSLINQLFRITQKNSKIPEIVDTFEGFINEKKNSEQEDIQQKVQAIQPITIYKKTTTECETGKPTNQDFDFDQQLPVPKISKIATQFRTSNSLPKSTSSSNHVPEIRNMQEQIKKLSEQIQQLSKKLSPHSQKNDSAPLSLCDRMGSENSQGNESNHPNDDQTQIPFKTCFSFNNIKFDDTFEQLKPSFIKKLYTVQENSSLHELQNSVKQNKLSILSDHISHLTLLDSFTISQSAPERICADPYIKQIKIAYKLEYQWSLFSPYLIQKQPFKQSLKILKSRSNFIFYGLMNFDNFEKEKIKDKSLWSKEGSIGCFVYNSKVYANGNEIMPDIGLSDVLALQGQVIQIKVNKIFKEIIWVVDGKNKIKVKSPYLFDRYDISKNWVPYVELFAQGDTVAFISQLL